MNSLAEIRGVGEVELARISVVVAKMKGCSNVEGSTGTIRVLEVQPEVQGLLSFLKCFHACKD